VGLSEVSRAEQRDCIVLTLCDSDREKTGQWGPPGLHTKQVLEYYSNTLKYTQIDSDILKTKVTESYEGE
jgi:hypothetical protein